MIDHFACREFAAGAVLEDLDPLEREQLDEHLAGCSACQSIAGQLREVVWDLALLTPDVEPPISLQRSVLEAVRASEPTPIASARSARAVSEVPRRPRWSSVAFGAPAAVLAVVAIGLGARVIALTDENAVAVAAAADVAADAQAQLVAREGAMAVLIDPDHEVAPLTAEALAPDARAVAVFEPGTTESYVMVADLPPTPAGHVYQLWVADTAGVHPLGTFHHPGGTAFVAPFGVDLATSDAAMITLEPDGGSVGEPGPQVVFGTL